MGVGYICLVVRQGARASWLRAMSAILMGIATASLGLVSWEGVGWAWWHIRGIVEEWANLKATWLRWSWRSHGAMQASLGPCKFLRWRHHIGCLLTLDCSAATQITDGSEFLGMMMGHSTTVASDFELQASG
jgi:hypothetical protein